LLDHGQALFLRRNGDAPLSRRMSIEILEHLRTRQALSLAYFDVFTLLAAFSVLLVCLIPRLGAGASESGFPHSPQNLIPGAFSKPQPGHVSFSGAPHSPQNFMPLAFSKPQDGQRMILGPRADAES
jgi:hypothetical protein